MIDLIVLNDKLICGERKKLNGFYAKLNNQWYKIIENFALLIFNK